MTDTTSRTSSQTYFNWLCVKDIDTTQTANIKIVVLQAWHIFTIERIIAMFYLKCDVYAAIGIT